MRIFSELELGNTTDSSRGAPLSRTCGNLGAVRTIIACGSARGGVGKSALVVNLAAALALTGRKIGIVDADLNSPSISAMLGMRMRRQAFVSEEEIEPATGPLGLRIISSEFLPEGEPPVSFVDIAEATPVSQNGAHPNEFGYLATMRRLLGHAQFGTLDLVLIDLASGIEHIYRLFKIVPSMKLLLVTHPSDLSARAMRTALSLASLHPDAVVGVVENMAGFNCDGCHQVRPLLPYGAVATRVREAGAALLERLPFDSRFAETCDRGVIFVREYPQTPLAKQIGALARVIDKAVEARALVEGASSS
jgi:ATP-binding protein involved in chromosome partitioning